MAPKVAAAKKASCAEPIQETAGDKLLGAAATLPGRTAAQVAARTAAVGAIKLADGVPQWPWIVLVALAIGNLWRVGLLVWHWMILGNEFQYKDQQIGLLIFGSSAALTMIVGICVGKLGTPGPRKGYSAKLHNLKVWVVAVAFIAMQFAIMVQLRGWYTDRGLPPRERVLPPGVMDQVKEQMKAEGHSMFDEVEGEAAAAHAEL
mmetsp:Transcript_67699/g.177532  ORF Transcript_67699/g.177532 Transcript_67699/m.177532 type:complete len:205 (+) Transcript_67699:69-683(+)